jgi:predicted ATPase with chaperone activity
MVIDTERPVAPGSVTATGLDMGVLADLALKTLYFASNIEGTDLTKRLALSLNATTEVLEFLRRERLCEVLGGTGRSAATLRSSLTSKGIDRAVAALAMSGYVGPAPVPLGTYLDQVRRQTIHNVELTRQVIEESLSHLVFPQRTLDLIGQAVSSKRATLLYGASGNGKTSAVEGLARALSGHILIPHAVEVMRETIQVYDPSAHDAVDDGDSSQSPERGVPDRRWVVIRRPAVFAAGELAANHLELMLDQVHKTYEAPIQMKANGGVLVIDDFGRQRLEAAYLLNRWVTPLERQVDHLSLHSGARFEVPFDVIPIFVSNLPPMTLADDAFLRRIRYKIDIPGPDSATFIEILKRECQRSNVSYDEDAATYLMNKYFGEGIREMRGCHPRDFVEAIADAARYQGDERSLTTSTIDEAHTHYFVDN